VLRSISGLSMKSAGQQIQGLVREHLATFDPRVKCVLVAAYQNDGRTVLQPLVAERESKTIAELFNNKTLEVWLSNGENDIAQFDVAILKYKQVLQPLTKCQKVKTEVCLKNHFENIVSCEQCPLSASAGEIANDKC